MTTYYCSRDLVVFEQRTAALVSYLIVSPLHRSTYGTPLQSYTGLLIRHVRRNWADTLPKPFSSLFALEFLSETPTGSLIQGSW